MLNPGQIRELQDKVELFHGLSADDIAKIFSRGMTMRVSQGETVFYKGTVGSQMYIVLGGLLGVVDNDKVLAKLRTGDIFGEMALVTQEPRSATVQAIEDSHLFVLSESTFQKLLTKRVAIRILLNIVRTQSRRLRDVNAKLSG